MRRYKCSSFTVTPIQTCLRQNGPKLQYQTSSLTRLNDYNQCYVHLSVRITGIYGARVSLPRGKYCRRSHPITLPSIILFRRQLRLKGVNSSVPCLLPFIQVYHVIGDYTRCNCTPTFQTFLSEA